MSEFQNPNVKISNIQCQMSKFATQCQNFKMPMSECQNFKSPMSNVKIWSTGAIILNAHEIYIYGAHSRMIQILVSVIMIMYVPCLRNDTGYFMKIYRILEMQNCQNQQVECFSTMQESARS